MLKRNKMRMTTVFSRMSRLRMGFIYNARGGFGNLHEKLEGCEF